MGYRMMGALHARLHHTGTRLADRAGSEGQSGQGTVEYVALILLIAVVLGAVVVAGRKMNGHDIAGAIVGKLKDSIKTVGSK
jgi:hypothetical protein